MIGLIPAPRKKRIARWLQRDPIGERGGLNLYEYCGDDTISRRDPKGLCCEKQYADMLNAQASDQKAKEADDLAAETLNASVEAANHLEFAYLVAVALATKDAITEKYDNLWGTGSAVFVAALVFKDAIKTVDLNTKMLQNANNDLHDANDVLSNAYDAWKKCMARNQLTPPNCPCK